MMKKSDLLIILLVILLLYGCQVKRTETEAPPMVPPLPGVPQVSPIGRVHIPEDITAPNVDIFTTDKKPIIQLYSKKIKVPKSAKNAELALKVKRPKGWIWGKIYMLDYQQKKWVPYELVLPAGKKLVNGYYYDRDGLGAGIKISVPKEALKLNEEHGNSILIFTCKNIGTVQAANWKCGCLTETEEGYCRRWIKEDFRAIEVADAEEAPAEENQTKEVIIEEGEEKLVLETTALCSLNIGKLTIDDPKTFCMDVLGTDAREAVTEINKEDLVATVFKNEQLLECKIPCDKKGAENVGWCRDIITGGFTVAPKKRCPLIVDLAINSVLKYGGRKYVRDTLIKRCSHTALKDFTCKSETTDLKELVANAIELDLKISPRLWIKEIRLMKAKLPSETFEIHDIDVSSCVGKQECKMVLEGIANEIENYPFWKVETDLTPLPTEAVAEETGVTTVPDEGQTQLTITIQKEETEIVNPCQIDESNNVCKTRTLTLEGDYIIKASLLSDKRWRINKIKIMKYSADPQVGDKPLVVYPCKKSETKTCERIKTFVKEKGKQYVEVELTEKTAAAITPPALEVPGIIQAEDFDSGKEGQAFHDKLELGEKSPTNKGDARYREPLPVDVFVSGTEHVVNLMRGDPKSPKGEWLKYTTTVKRKGLYYLHARVASQNGGELALLSKFDTPLANIKIPASTDWTTFSLPDGIGLQEGQIELKIRAEQGSFDIDWIEFKEKETVPKLYISFDNEEDPFKADYVKENTMVFGAGTITQGKIGKGLKLDGIKDRIRVADIQGFGTGNIPHTIEAWVKVLSLPQENQRSWMLTFGRPATGAHHWLLNPDTSTEIGVWGNVGSQARPKLKEGWTHIVTSSDGSEFNTYVNGELVGSKDAKFHITDLPNNGKQLLIGKSYGDSEKRFTGIIDEIKLYDEALEEDEIKLKYYRTSQKQPETVEEKFVWKDEFSLFEVANPIVRWWFPGSRSDSARHKYSTAFQDHRLGHGSWNHEGVVGILLQQRIHGTIPIYSAGEVALYTYAWDAWGLQSQIKAGGDFRKFTISEEFKNKLIRYGYHDYGLSGYIAPPELTEQEAREVFGGRPVRKLKGAYDVALNSAGDIVGTGDQLYNLDARQDNEIERVGGGNWKKDGINGLMGYIPAGPVQYGKFPSRQKLTIPGTIQAEDFDLGGENRATHDTGIGVPEPAYRYDERLTSTHVTSPDPGIDVFYRDIGSSKFFAVGWIEKGEWMIYTVNIEKDGIYDIKAYVASEETINDAFELSITENVFNPSPQYKFIAKFDAPYTGSGASFTISEGKNKEGQKTPIPLKKGQYLLKINILNGVNRYNIDRLDFIER